jgi:nitric oxide dioxygenase
MITEADKAAIVRSWRLVIPVGENVADLFYRRLFELKPEYRALFTDDMKAQKRKLLQMLAFIVKSLNWVDTAWREEVSPDEDLMLVVLALGRRHKDIYKIPDESYAVVGEVLIWTFDYGLGEAFTEDVRRAWLLVYTLVAKTMRMGSLSVDRDAGARARSAALEIGESAIRADQKRLGLLEPEPTSESRTHGSH